MVVLQYKLGALKPKDNQIGKRAGITNPAMRNVLDYNKKESNAIYFQMNMTSEP